MFEIQTIIVYLSLFICMVGLSKYAQKTHKWIPIIIALILYSIIFGVRYGVGTDFFSYLNYFKNPSLINENVEGGFVFLIKLLSSQGVHYSFFYGIVAFIQIYFIYKSIQKYEYAFASLTFVFMFGAFWLTFANGLRQILAFCILVYAITYLVRGKWLQYIILGGLALLFHKSAIIPLIIYPIFCIKKLYLNNTFWQIIGLVLALVLMNVNIVSLVLNNVEKIVYALGYEFYLENDSEFSEETGYGLGFFITLFSYIILIVNSKGMKQMYKDTWIPYAYNLFYIGVILKYIFISSQLFSRINYYFIYFELFVGAFTLLYLWRKKRNLCYVLAGLYVLTFAANMYRMDINDAMYFFFWQDFDYNMILGHI